MEMADSIPVNISVIGTEIIDGEEDKIEIITSGLFSQKDGKTNLKYTETNESGEETEILLTIDGNSSAIIQRSTGPYSSLIIENGVRHNGFLNMQFGEIALNIVGKEIKNNLTLDGDGELLLKYELELGGTFTSSHTLIVKSKKQKTNPNF